jgi:hypothetical protein
VAHTITIQYPPGQSRDFHFNLFTWADDLNTLIEYPGLAKVHDLDNVRESVVITIKKTSNLGEVLKILNKRSEWLPTPKCGSPPTVTRT